MDAIDTRVKHDAPKHVHFVSHSFGGVLLCSAFKEGLAEVLPHGTRCALIAPPLRGAVLARTLEEMDFRGPDVVRRAVRAMARTFTGPSSGMELRTCGPAWFEATGHIPNDIPVLVVEGAPGHVNPMIRGESDFVVGSDETQLNRPHRRLRVGLTHNLLLMSPTVLGDVRKFVRGEEVGILDEGKTMECP